MASTDGKILGINELTLYDNLLKQYINFKKAKIEPNQIDGLFSNEIELVSFTTGTDNQISAMINGYYNGDLTLQDIQSVWHIGDTRDIDIDTISAIGNNYEVGESHRAQTITIQILDFIHDNLTTSINNKTKALITVDLKNCLKDENVSDTQGSNNIETGYMNANSTNLGGWRDCARRMWCNYGFYISLPQYIVSLIKEVDKLSSEGNESLEIITTSDSIFLLSENEIFGVSNAPYSIGEGEGEQYELYKTSSNINKLPIFDSQSSSSSWWTRSPGSFSGSFIGVGSNGGPGYPPANALLSLAPAFCL